MLPLLPALILLLLQGPSNFERLAVDGRLPAALEAINRQIARPGSERLSESEEHALASLMAVGASDQLARALMSFLRNGGDKPNPAEPISREFSPPPICRRDSLPAQDGFARSQRTRDGPAIFGASS